MTEYMVSSTEHKRVLILTDLHFCDKAWHGLSCLKRMELLQKVLQKEAAENPFDVLLCLGDYSLDFWAWESKGSYLCTPSVSNTENFVQQIVPKFPVHPYMIPGNHEQYGHLKWKEITGYPRQYNVVYGKCVFLMCDTFGGNLEPTEHSDGTYSGLDFAFLKETIEKYPNHELILCMHDLMPELETNEVKELVKTSGRFCCGFAGHTHRSDTVLLGKEWGYLPLFYCGDFSYTADCEQNAYPNWGFRQVDLSQGIRTKYCPCLQKNDWDFEIHAAIQKK